MVALKVLTLLLVLTILGSLSHLAVSMSSGAPAMACASLRPLHGFHLAKPASASQFFVSQSALSYKPGENITVDLVTQSNERHFRGFIVQAYDPSSGSQLGKFVSDDNSRNIDNCSAATHRNSRLKKSVSVTWLPPQNSSSLLSSLTRNATSHHQVRFRASIVVSYEEFYTGFESSDQLFDKFDFAKRANNNQTTGSSQLININQSIIH